MKVEPYLFFDGRCEEALAFYRKALGAEVDFLMHNSESPDPAMRMPGADNLVLHCNFRIGDTTLCASDGRCAEKPSFQGFSLIIAVSTEAEAERLFAALSDGGQVQMPLTKTFYSPLFGMTADRFGVSWMILVMQ